MIKKSNSKRTNGTLDNADLSKVHAGSVGYDRFDYWLAGRIKIERLFPTAVQYIKK